MKNHMKHLITIAFVFTCLFNYGQQKSASVSIGATYTKSIISNTCWSTNQVIATPTQQNALAIYENYVYVTYYNTDRYLCVSRSSDYGKGDWKTVVLSHRYEMRNGVYDSHNTPNIAISPKDKRIHLSFDMHARDLRYIISAENLAVAPDSVFTADQFSATRDYITEDLTKITSVTYPRFILGNDSTLLFAYRGEGGSGNANNFLASYKNDGYWNTPTKIVNGKTGTYSGTAGTTSTRCAYFNDFVFKNGVLYLTWTWRETPDGDTNHDVMFAYSEDNGQTWKNTNNETLELPMHLNSKDIKVVTVAQSEGLINHNGCAVDALGNVHAVMRMGSVYQHFYRIGTAWKSQAVSGVSVGDRPKLYCGDMSNTLYLVARSGAEVSLYASDHSDDWQTWTKVKGVSDDYMCATNSFISSDGKTLRTMAVTSDNELHLITWNLETPPADTTRYLFFSNLSNGQQLEAGTSLTVKASVGSAFKEVSLWSGTTNLGTKTSAPYEWSNHPILTEMNKPAYTFKLVAKDSNNVEVEKVISISTDAPSVNKFTGEGKYTFYNPNKTKWMGYDVATNDALVTDNGDSDINKFVVVANGNKFNIFTGDYQKVVVINAASGYTSMLADTTSVVLASNDALFSFTETGVGTELYFITSGDNYKLNVKSDGSDIGRGTTELPNYQWQLTKIGDIETGIHEQSILNSGVRIYPNPATNLIFFEGNQVNKAKVYTLSGQLLKNYAVSSNQVNISQLEKGMYLLQLEDLKGNVFTERLVIE